MNKSRFFKILAPIVALGLLVGALIGISAQADTEVADASAAPEIISMNVEYGADLVIYYAVDKDTVAGVPALEVLSDDEGTEVLAVVTDYEIMTVHGKECYVFKGLGVAPGQLNKLEYVRATDGDLKGEILSYSVEEYLYGRLYIKGFAAKTVDDGEDYTRRNLYFKLLKYGQSAQALFYEDDTDIIGSNPGVMVSGADVAGGEYVKGDYVALVPSVAEGFSYWKVDEYTPFGEYVGQKLLASGYEYVILDNSAIVTPVYNADSMEGVLPWVANTITFNGGIPDASKYEISTGSESEAAYVQGETTWAVELQEDGNKVLHIDKDCTGVLVDENGEKTLSYNWGVTTRVYTTEKQESANVAIFEAKVLYKNVNKLEAEISMGPSNTDGSQAAIKYYFSGSGKSIIFSENENGKLLSEEIPLTGASTNAWFTVRIEYRVTETGVESKLFINGNHVHTGTKVQGKSYFTSGEYNGKAPLASNIAYTTFLVNNNVAGDIYFDDISLKLVCEK